MDYGPGWARHLELLAQRRAARRAAIGRAQSKRRSQSYKAQALAEARALRKAAGEAVASHPPALRAWDMIFAPRPEPVTPRLEADRTIIVRGKDRRLRTVTVETKSRTKPGRKKQ